MDLNFHGVAIEITSAIPGLIDEVRHDFGYFDPESSAAFADAGEKKFRLGVSVAPTPPLWRPRWRTRASQLYRSAKGSRSQRVGFFDRAWVEYDFARRRCEIYCRDESIAFEATYHVLLSYVGERLDRRGWHRMHGLGASFGNSAVHFLAPSGTGKSTLALEFLSDPEFRIFSDDTPLVDKKGNMKAFPQRIALKERPAIEGRYVRVFSRAAYGAKFVVGHSFFKKKIAGPAALRWLVLLERGSGAGRDDTDRLVEVSRWRLCLPLLKWLVVGYEVPQIWQLFLRRSGSDVAAKIAIAFSRLRAAAYLLGHCRAARFRLGPDPGESARALRRAREIFG